MLWYMNVPSMLIPQIMFGGLDKFALLAVPFFIFAGDIMARGGVSRRIVDCILALFGRARAARPITTIAASEFFGAVSGSSPATVAAMGKLMYPSLREGGYSEKFSLGLITSAGGIASVMPPSILMILYGASAEQSVAELFAAGVIPALLLGFGTLLYILWYSRRVNSPPEEKRSFSQVVKLVVNALPALGTPVVILGGIYSGVFSWVLTTSGVPQALVQYVSATGETYWSTLLIINIFLLIIGCLVDPISAIVLFTPILIPIVQYLGIDLIHFGVIMAVNLSIGMFTPPFGLNIFTSHALFGARMSTICAGLVPFIIVQLLVLMLITYVPVLSLFGAGFVK
ncbi:TRAP transporter large permease [Pusillimonas minor]|uniref:TRAP transporter large permease n=1 Tax=Pusillimonas minor TaxID=2697024 RepID=UPI003211A4CA